MRVCHINADQKSKVKKNQSLKNIHVLNPASSKTDSRLLFIGKSQIEILVLPGGAGGEAESTPGPRGPERLRVAEDAGWCLGACVGHGPSGHAGGCRRAQSTGHRRLRRWVQ